MALLRPALYPWRYSRRLHVRGGCAPRTAAGLPWRPAPCTIPCGLCVACLCLPAHASHCPAALPPLPTLRLPAARPLPASVLPTPPAATTCRARRTRPARWSRCACMLHASAPPFAGSRPCAAGRAEARGRTRPRPRAPAAARAPHRHMPSAPPCCALVPLLLCRARAWPPSTSTSTAAATPPMATPAAAPAWVARRTTTPPSPP